jgi:hypothetical protein
VDDGVEERKPGRELVVRGVLDGERREELGADALLEGLVLAQLKHDPREGRCERRSAFRGARQREDRQDVVS